MIYLVTMVTIGIELEGGGEAFLFMYLRLMYPIMLWNFAMQMTLRAVTTWININIEIKIIGFLVSVIALLYSKIYMNILYP